MTGARSTCFVVLAEGQNAVCMQCIGLVCFSSFQLAFTFDERYDMCRTGSGAPYHISGTSLSLSFYLSLSVSACLPSLDVEYSLFVSLDHELNLDLNLDLHLDLSSSLSMSNRYRYRSQSRSRSQYLVPPAALVCPCFNLVVYLLELHTRRRI